MRRVIPLLFALALATGLSGCPTFDRRAVPNQPPVADAGEDLFVAAGETVVIEGSATDPESDGVTLRWSQVAGTPVTPDADPETGVLSFTAPFESTTLVFSLMATDALGATGEPDLVRVVVEYNRPPVADAGGYVEIPRGEEVRLVGRGADPDGDTIEGWRWEVLSAPSGTDLSSVLSEAESRNPVFRPPAKGEYLVSLVVTDARGATSEPDALVAVALNTPPEARASAAVDPADPGLVHLDASASADPDGDAIATYAWRVASAPATGSVTFDPSPDVASPTAALVGRGVFFLELTVTDTDGAASAPVQLILQVNHPPVAAVTSQLVRAEENTTLGLDATPSFDPDGDPLSFTWNRTAGSDLFPTPLSGARPRVPAPSFAALARAGEESAVTYRLEVSDGDLMAAPVEVTVEVLPSEANFVFLSDGAGADDLPGCGSRVHPCRSLRAAAAATDLDGDGTPDGRDIVATTGTYSEVQTDVAFSWPAGVSLYGGRDPTSYRRAGPSDVLVTSDVPLGCSLSGTSTPPILRVPPSAGSRQLFDRVTITYASACGSAARISPLLVCEGCFLWLRDAELTFISTYSGSLPAPWRPGHPLWVRLGGDVLVQRSRLETRTPGMDDTYVVRATDGSVRIEDSEILGVAKRSTTIVREVPLLLEGQSSLTLLRSHVHLGGPSPNRVSMRERRVALRIEAGSARIENSVLTSTLGPNNDVIALLSGSLSLWNSAVLGDGTGGGPASGVYAEVPMTVVNTILDGQPAAVDLATPAALGAVFDGNALRGVDGVLARCAGSDVTDIATLNDASGTTCNTSGQPRTGNLDTLCPLVAPDTDDYHLLTSAGANACVDAGLAISPLGGPAPVEDMDGEARPGGSGGLWDIGPDEIP